MQHWAYKLKQAKYVLYKDWRETIIEWNFAKLQQLRTYRWTFSTFINATLYFFLSCTIIINIALFWMEQINDLSYMCVFAQKKKCIIYLYINIYVKNTFVIIVLKACLQICVHVRSHLLIILDNNPRLF